MKRFLYLVILCASVCASVSSNAQTTEICANSIDDDGDGFIDCFDGECAKETVCTGGYVGNDLNCEAKPSEFPKFSLALESASENGTAIHLGRIAVGDIDRDGTPEMITTNQYSKKIFILNGDNTAGVNTIQKQITVDYSPSYTDILIGNIDNDNCGEIFTISTGWTLRAYDCNLNFLWSRALGNDPGMMGLADFNGDGKVELYARNAIYNAHTGDVIVAPDGWGDSKTRPNGGPVAVDILNDATKNAHLLTDAVKDDKLELVVGDTIFSVNIGAGTITPEKIMPNFARRTDSDATSIADYNLDGSLDVIVSGKNTVDGNTTIFFWDVKTGLVKTYSDPIAGNFTIQNCQGKTGTSTGEYYKNGWHQGTGRVNIADLDGDGKLNASFVSGKFLYALKEDMTLLWKVTVNEETSGNTGCTLFDFNGDGQSEVVYRDEKFIYIINGTNGSVFTQQPCVSRTNREYPIVADVDADGNTELCVTCRTADFIQNGGITDPTDPDYLKSDQSNFCTIENSEFSHVRVFRSGAEPWVPARRVWNQHGYFNVNINDNLSIPKIQQKHHLVFSENVCTVGKNRPLNSFLNQSPFLNSLGCPKYASPDLAYVQNSLTIDPPTCPEGDFTISFKITNLGDVSLSGIVPITFYNGDPTKKDATKLNTITVNLNAFKVGGVQTITKETVKGPGSPFTLYIVLNDGGTTVPTPIKLPNTNFIECNYANNILSSPVEPLPITLTALKVKDNEKCSPGTTADNGAVRAFVPDGALENVTDYTFYWSIGNTAKPIADHEGPTWTNRNDNTYTVFALHNTAKCASETKKVTVVDVSTPVNIKIVLETPYDNCKNPNAKLRAVINAKTATDNVGDPPGQYNFTWYAGNDALGVPIGNSEVKAGLSPGAYTVLVEHKATKCKNIDTKNIVDQTVLPPKPTVVKSDATCSVADSGSASASVGGVTVGYKFEWSKGSIAKPVADFTGVLYEDLAPGEYTVVATRNSTQCTSPPEKITIIKTVNPTVTTSGVAHQTSCDVTKPNGSASAAVGGTTVGYKFEWFFGQNTLLANRVDTTSTAKGLKVGIYTVKATNKSTGCFDTEEVTINFAVVTPTLTLASSSHATQCAPANGSITVSVTPGLLSEYTFSWYKGDVVKSTPDFADTVATLTGLPAGKYTVKANFRSRHCETAPLTVTINDASPVITLGNATDIILPSDCNDNKGTMKVSVSAPGNTLGFDFEWRKGHEPFMEPAITTVSNTATSSTISSLKPGVYTLIATNKNTGCSSSRPYDLPFIGAHVLAFQYKVDPENCVPNNDGEIGIKLTPANTLDEDDYRIDVFVGKNDLGPTGTVHASKIGSLNNDEPWENLTPRFYTFVAVSTHSSVLGCRSVPVTVEIVQKTANPAFSLNQAINNTNCPGGAAFSGEISITIANPTDYSYAWYEGPNSSSPILGTNTTGTSTGTTATDLPAGKYTVVVTKTGTPSGGCFSTATYQLYDNLPMLSIPQANITPTPITLCDDLDGGSAVLSGISVNPGPAGNLSDYLIQWYSSNTTGPAIGTGSSISNLVAGTYYVKAKNTTTGCSTDGLTEFTIEDKSMNTVNVDLQSFVVPTRCIRPLADNVQGSLEVLASGVGNSYIYTWYAGQSATGTPIANTAQVNNLAPKLYYTVDVFNNTTHCRTSESFLLPEDKKPVLISASAAPNTVCIDTQKDGSVLATVIGSESMNYNYNWFIETVKLTPDFTSIPSNGAVTGLNDGNYIVVITDKDDAACFASDTVEVKNGRIIPVVVAEALAPLTTCDPARPDGVAAANVGGNIIYHRFDWFASAPPTGASFYAGSQASSLAAGSFSVIATDFVTGCSDTTQVMIDIKQLPIPIPTIEILSMVTSCIMDNGALSASVDDNTRDYIFDWHNGTLEKSSPDFTGETYDSLAVGPYSVTATSRITGCKSPLATEEIINDPKFPDFSVTTVATECRENSFEPGTGYAAIFMTNAVDTDSIFWSFGGSVISTGPIATGLNVGTYDVTVISALGCETTKPVTIKTEIHPYNGVSRNGDGQNDVFHINCIESFPSNLVKIFNRAGTMVYEAQGYDNNGIVFDGQSNRGINVMGNNLPSGTYFYIIDKKDGSKPMAGYLEIVN